MFKIEIQKYEHSKVTLANKLKKEADGCLRVKGGDYDNTTVINSNVWVQYTKQEGDLE